MADIWFDVDTALAEVPVNLLPLIDDTDFKTIEAAVAFNAAGLALFWNFVTTAGAQTCTGVTPTAAGDYDWTDQGTSGMYSIEMPASGGASANNDTEGFGWFTGVATGVLPWRGPVCGFRAAALNNSLIDAGTTGLLAPATAARNLVVDANGLADANVVKVGPTGSGTAQTAGDIIGDTNDIQTKIGTPAGASMSADLAAIEAQTDDIGAAGAGLTAVPWNASWDAEVESEVLDALNTILLDSIPADGTLPTTRQALYMLTQFMLERAVSGTTVTVKKADGSTSLFTLTLNDATTPTSITRAT